MSDTRWNRLRAFLTAQHDIAVDDRSESLASPSGILDVMGEIEQDEPSDQTERPTMPVHHGKCPKALAWDIPNVPCECPRGWPRKEKPMPDTTTPAPSRWRKKPVEIAAFRLGLDPIPDWFMDRVSDCTITLHGGHPRDRDSLESATIRTLEGDMIARRGDYVIRGVKGEIYPCKPDIFEVTYEPA